jgi:hypothetical protein
MSKDLSVCYSYDMWGRHVMYVTYALLLTFYLAEIWYPDTEMGTQEKPIGACPPNTPTNINMCKFESTMSSAKTEFRFLIAFVLAGYVANSVATWKERRTDYASLCGNTRNLLLNIGSLFPDTSKCCDESPKALASRWILLAYELAVLKSRGHMDSLQGRQYLEASGDLQPGEWDLLANGDRHTAALFWTQNLIDNMVKSNEIKENPGLKLCEDISSFRGKANDMMSSLNRDRPFPYVALCGLLVKLNVFIFSTWKAVEWSAWLRTFGYRGLFNQIRIWADILVLFVWNVSYMGLYDLGYYLENPFGNRRIDVPHEAISSGLHKLGKYCSAENNMKLPPSIKKVQ